MTTPKPRPCAVPVVVNVSGPLTVPRVPLTPGAQAKLPSGAVDGPNVSRPCGLTVNEPVGTGANTGETVYVTGVWRVFPATSVEVTVNVFVPTVAVSIG